MMCGLKNSMTRYVLCVCSFCMCTTCNGTLFILQLDSVTNTNIPAVSPEIYVPFLNNDSLYFLLTYFRQYLISWYGR